MDAAHGRGVRISYRGLVFSASLSSKGDGIHRPFFVQISRG